MSPRAFLLFIAVAASEALAITPQCAAAPASRGSVHVTTDATFAQDVLKASGPAVVEFHASFCWSCVLLTPHVKKLAAKYSGRVGFWTLNAGWDAESRRRYGFRAVPTLVFYRDGKEVTRLEGVPHPNTDAALEAFVERGLAAPR